jgi:hypothetical protein
MPAGGVAQSIAAQIELLHPELEKLILMSSVLWKRFQKVEAKAVSNRPMRVAFQTSAGGRFKAVPGAFDGVALGRGTGPNEVPGYVSCVAFSQAIEYTALAKYSTDSSVKAIENYVSLTLGDQTKTFSGYLDALAATSDGSNTLCAITSTVAGGYVVPNANFFQDNQFIDVWSALGGAFRGTVQILSVDVNNNTIWLTGAIAPGSIAGDLLLPEGSSAVANTGISGIPAYNAAGNTGNYMTISKAAFPGKFNTPSINLANKSLTPAVIRALSAAGILAMGEDNDGADAVWHCNVDVQAAWENNALTVQTIVANQNKGDQATDMGYKKAPTMIAGVPILLNVRAIPGRADRLDFKHWGRIETKAAGLYDVDGKTTFPAYANDGGLATSDLQYTVIMTQLANFQPKRSAFLSGIAIPKNFFGN